VDTHVKPVKVMQTLVLSVKETTEMLHPIVIVKSISMMMDKMLTVNHVTTNVKTVPFLNVMFVLETESTKKMDVFVQMHIMMLLMDL
jgi:hypothetical protein